MLTFKQLEALFWIVQLGSFEAAATKLNTTQSAISKRIQELESAFDLELFDRSRRTAKLTERGLELFHHAKDLLDRRDAAVESVIAKEVLIRRLSIGVTELTALTWLPKWVEAIRRTYPRVTVDAEVDLGSPLRDRLAADTIDLIVVPAGPVSERFVSVPVGEVENAWMCVPKLVPDASSIPLTEISRFPLLTQGMASGTGATYTRFLQDNGVTVNKVLTSSNLVAQIGLTLSGLGVSYLPKESLGYLIESGVLGTIKTEPPLPPVKYVAMYRGDHLHALNSEVAQLAADCCDFGSILLQPQK